MSTDESEPTTSSPETSQLNGVHEDSPIDDDSEGSYSDAVESMHESSLENSSAIAEDDVPSDVSSPDRVDLGWEMVDGKMAIAFSPDYIVYRDIYCTDSKVTFSTNCVQVRGSTACGNKQIFSIELAIEDVIDIQSQWCGRFGMAEVTLHVIARDSMHDENTNGSSDIQKLEFIVVDSYWCDKSEAILSLNLRYKALWKVMLNTESDIDQESLLGQKPMMLPKRYFPKFGENFEEVIYPEGDPDAVSISMRDIDLLKPDTFVNDTIIDFYIKYLKHKIPPEERHRFHFFNCFFFRKLADMDKDPSSAFEGKAAFLRVRKWTRKVDLFDKDFIFIPVNYNYHWSLIVICHPGEIANIKGEDIEKSARVPCILHMDSLKGSHSNLKDLIQSYLLEEWKERQKGAVEDISSKFVNLRFVSLELPQQQNLYDCGLFLLHYVERFLEDAPADFSPFMITDLSNFLTVRWFPTAEPSIKRGVIHRLVYDLLNKHSQSHSGNSEKCPSSNPATHNDNGNVELITERLSPSKDGCGHLLDSDGGQGIEMDLPQASSFRGSQCANDSGLVFREYFEATSSAALLLDVEYQAFGRTTSFNEFRSGLPPIEEEVEADMHLVHTTLTESSFPHLDAVTPEASALQHIPDDYRSEAFSDKKPSLEQKDEDRDSLRGKSTCDTENTSDVEIAENHSVEETSLDDETDHPVPVSTDNEDCSRTHGCTPCGDKVGVAGSQSPVQMLDHVENADQPTCLENPSEISPIYVENPSEICPTYIENPSEISPTYLENPSEISHQKDDNNGQANNGIFCDTLQPIDNLGSESDIHHPAKRIRLTCPLEVEREFSNTNRSDDLRL